MPFLPEAALSSPPATSLTCALKLPTPLAALATSLESTLIFGRRIIALPSRLLLPCLEAARARPPAAPAIAAPPATSGTFALLAALPTLLPALLALPLTSPTALRTASTFEPLPDEPLLEADFCERDLLLVDFALAFEAFVFEAFDFDADFALFGADSFRDLGFDLVFVWAIVPLSSELFPVGP
ncbi:MAG TPA: hypothetical protein VGV34_02965 [Solirubrobacterales bacterium]|nr:hypothetical protein [Solirubrobacterales bacterium]